MYSDIKKLWYYLTPRRHIQFSLTLILMVLASLAEMVSIGVVIPFLGALTNPEDLYKYSQIQSFISMFNIDSPEKLILPITALFIAAVAISAVIRLVLLYVITRLSYLTGSDLSVSMYKRTLYQSYAVHVARNSSEVINGITQKSNIVIHEVINSVLIFVSSIVIIVGVLLALFIIDSNVAFYSIASFSVIYLVIIKSTKDILRQNSSKIAQESTNLIKALQEGLGGIRDVIIDGSQDVYCDAYQKSDLRLRLSTIINRFISMSPRYVIESLGMILIAVLAYFLSQRSSGVSDAIPLLGALALGAQRLLPASQQVYSSFSAIAGAQVSLKDVLSLLDQPLPLHAEESQISRISFDKEISLQNIYFRYCDDMPWIMNNINFTIKKGSKVGFVGKTGSGKSTILDIIMGLLKPVHGVLRIDEHKVEAKDYRGWQRHIAHVPQFIYLSDGTIEENIALGVDSSEIDHIRLNSAIEQAQLSDLIDSWPQKYKTVIGELGVRLSGGQRQRIGIARALYKTADVLVFDEATSALDDETEKSIMSSINNIEDNITVIMIAHRITTLKECDRIIEVSSNGLQEVLYKDVINKQ